MDQIFFMGFGLTWCDGEGDPTWRIQTNSHSPKKYRVLGTLRNFPPFAKAFKCKKGEGMNRKKLVKDGGISIKNES